MGTTLSCRAQKCSPLMCRRDLPHFHARHRPLHQTQGRWAPTQIEGPLFELGKLGPGCNDRGDRAAGQGLDLGLSLKKWPCTLFPHVSLAPACE